MEKPLLPEDEELVSELLSMTPATINAQCAAIGRANQR